MYRHASWVEFYVSSRDGYGDVPKDPNKIFPTSPVT